MKKKIFIIISVFLTQMPIISYAQQEPTRIGILGPITDDPLWAEGLFNGFKLGLEEYNESNPQEKIELLFRDSYANPAKALKVAEDLHKREKVKLLAGGVFGHVVQAVSEFAKREKIPYVASFGASELITGENGHKYTFVVEPEAPFQGKALAQKAVQSSAKKWLTIAPNYNYGHSLVRAFKKELIRLNPHVTFAPSQWFPVGKINAGAIVQAAKTQGVEGIYFVLLRKDLALYLRECKLRRCAKNIEHFGAILGVPEVTSGLENVYPEEWIAGGYPIENIQTSAHLKFVQKYKNTFKIAPNWSALMGYITFKIIINAHPKENNQNFTKAFIRTIKTSTISTPVGPVSFQKKWPLNSRYMGWRKCIYKGYTKP